MKFLIVFVALFAVAFARPAAEVEIVKQLADVLPEGFSYSYETSDGSKQEASGQLKDVGSDHEGIVVHGSFSWVDAAGQTHTIVYVADENGYQPTGADVPVGPV